METTKFIFDITGRPKYSSAVEMLKKRTHRDILRVDGEVQLVEFNFARIYYRLSWRGFPRDLHRLTIANRNLLSCVGDYFTEWEYSVEVKIIEKGE